MAFRSCRFSPFLGLVALCSMCLFFSARAIRAQDSGGDAKNDDKPAAGAMVKLKITVVNPKGAPVANASVYVRFNHESGFLHHDKLAEMNFKTNQDGSVKVPPVPQGKIQIQVIAMGWHTFGEWYEFDQDEQAVTVKLEEPPHWY